MYMLQEIIKKSKSTNYDFRETAYPADPFSHLFEEWLEYYKLKWSIASVLKPSTILEIGVRFGYSAVAFLDAYPEASYLGIDLDSDLYGGIKGAIGWAEKIAAPFLADFLIANTQQMSKLPGGIYDLIHVDGQQDGDSSYHDLSLAVKQGRYILLDGFLWSQENFHAVSHFLLKFSDAFDWYGVIPGYAGELLIKVSEEYLRSRDLEICKSEDSQNIRSKYTSDYYLFDCGGFDSYKKDRGKFLNDSRLEAVASIASLNNSGRVLDLGCGRGELAYYFAQQGFRVTAVDYSKEAIELAERCFKDEEVLKSRVEFICDDINSIVLSEQYDLVVASDLIEHLSPLEVEMLYQKVKKHLKKNGLFIIHTFPNLWFYKYEYPRKRKVANSIGAYLPSEPRTRYELEMHINEQSPRVLRKQLKTYFNDVLLWFGDPGNPGGSLVKTYRVHQLAAAPSLFAVASNTAIDRQSLCCRLKNTCLPVEIAKKVRIIVRQSPNSVSQDEEFQVQIVIGNTSDQTLNSLGTNPIHISYHWLNKLATECSVFDGERTKLIPPLEGCRKVGITGAFDIINGLRTNEVKKKYSVRVVALPDKGEYTLRISLVQEGMFWFDQLSANCFVDILMCIV